MNESVFDRILSNASLLKIDPYADGLIDFINSENMSIDQIDAVCKVFDHLRDRQKEVIINTHLKMSRLPLKEPKTFDNFDFSNVHGKQVDALKNLPSLSALYARKNLAFIGPQGVGKTHLAMAFGRECCCNGMKAYFLKATELNQRFVDAVNRAPMWIRKDLYEQHLHHIDFRFAPFQYDDDEICLRSWLLGLQVGWYDAKFHSLTAGGMRLWNSEFTKEQMERNGHLLYQMYADKMEDIAKKVEESNQEL